MIFGFLIDMKINTLYNSNDFLDALAQGTLIAPITREGIAKPDPNDPQAFLFSEGGACGPWLKVPEQAVESVEFIRVVPCKDHEHPFIVIRFIEPEKGR